MIQDNSQKRLYSLFVFLNDQYKFFCLFQYLNTNLLSLQFCRRLLTSTQRDSERELLTRCSLWTGETLLQRVSRTEVPVRPPPPPTLLLCQRRAPESGQFAAGSFLSSSSCVLLADSPPSPASCPWSDKANASSPLPCPTPHLCWPLKLTHPQLAVSRRPTVIFFAVESGDLHPHPPPPQPPSCREPRPPQERLTFPPWFCRLQHDLNV